MFKPQHIFSKTTIATTAAIIVAACIIAIGFNTPAPKASAQSSCSWEDVNGVDISSTVAASDSNRSASDDANSSLNYSNYINSDEYVEQLRYDAQVNVHTAGDCMYDADCYGNASASGPGGSISLSKAEVVAGGSNSDSQIQTFTTNVGPAASGGSASFSIDVGAGISDSEPHIHGVQAGASISNVQLRVCDIPVAPPSNGAPTANDDGMGDDRVCVNNGETVDLDVTDNDEDPDNDVLTITNVTAGNYDAPKAYSSFIRYTPNAPLSDPSDSVVDTFTYTISDGNGGTDNANVYVEVREDCQLGQITFDFSSGEGGSAQPIFNEETLAPGLGGEKWYVQLSPDVPRLAVIEKNMVTPPDGYKFDDSDITGWVFKEVDGQEKTGQPNTAKLQAPGLGEGGTCDPATPTVGSCTTTTFGSSENDLITSGSEFGQCATDESPEHPAYTNISEAQWIWESDTIQDPTGPETATFQKQFSIADASDVENAEITFAADNFYRVVVNGQVVDEDPRTSSNDGPSVGDGDNFSSAKTVDISSELTDGTNTVRFIITNEYQNPAGNNPAGVIYRIDIDTYNSSCAPDNQAPTAKAYTTMLNDDGAVHRYRMNASNSSDPETSNDDLTFQWETIEVESTDPGMDTSVYDPAGSGEITEMLFTNPREDTVRTYTVQLTVTDPEGLSATTTVEVDVTCNDPTSGGADSCISESP